MENNSPDIVNDFTKGLAKAFDRLFDCDRVLFKLGTAGINEQTLTFRLGFYLIEIFRNYDVDCEYNRFWDKRKMLCEGSDDWMKPDIIVHKRQSVRNLMALEAKKQSYWHDVNQTPEDVHKKLQALTFPAGLYKYEYGLAWRIAPTDNPHDHQLKWYGKKLPFQTVGEITKVLTASPT